MLCQRTDRPREAIENYGAALELALHLPELYCNRGIAYAKLGKYQLATRDFDSALDLNSQNQDVYYYRAMAHLVLGNIGQALEDMRTAAGLGHAKADDFLKEHGLSIDEVMNCPGN